MERFSYGELRKDGATADAFIAGTLLPEGRRQQPELRFHGGRIPFGTLGHGWRNIGWTDMGYIGAQKHNHHAQPQYRI